MAVLAPNVGNQPAPLVHAIKDDLLDQPCSFANSSGHYPMEGILVGATEYCFRRQIIGRAYGIEHGAFEFVVDGLAPFLVGMGPTQQAARDDWQDQVHVTFQRLWAMRPFEMNEEQHDLWRTLESVIDAAQLRRTTPIRMRQLGRVEYKRLSHPCAVHWIGGPHERVSVDVMPSDFYAFKPGQWIEAICERDPLSGRLIRVTHVEPIPDVRMMTIDQQEEYWNRLPTSASLPESELDWTRPD